MFTNANIIDLSQDALIYELFNLYFFYLKGTNFPADAYSFNKFLNSLVLESL